MSPAVSFYKHLRSVSSAKTDKRFYVQLESNGFNFFPKTINLVTWAIWPKRVEGAMQVREVVFLPPLQYNRSVDLQHHIKALKSLLFALKSHFIL